MAQNLVIAANIAVVLTALVALLAFLRQQHQERRQAALLLPAVYEEFLWVATAAETVVELVGAYSEQKAHAALRWGNQRFMVTVRFDADAVLTLINYSFPTMVAFKDVLRYARNDTGTEVATAYARMLTPQHHMRTTFQQLKDPTAPDSASLQTFLEGARQMLSAARRACRVLSYETKQGVPQHWDPSSTK